MSSKRRTTKKPSRLDFPSDYPFSDRVVQPPEAGQRKRSSGANSRGYTPTSTAPTPPPTASYTLPPYEEDDKDDDDTTLDRHQSTEALLYGIEDKPRRSPTALLARRFPTNDGSPTSRVAGNFNTVHSADNLATMLNSVNVTLPRTESVGALNTLAKKQWGTGHPPPRDTHMVSIMRPKNFDTPNTAEAEVFFPKEGANADVSQVRVEGYYHQGTVGALIPNDLPRSTLLYVLTASDGRDLIFKTIQYSLQLLIIFLKTPSLFSAEMLPIADSLAVRFWKNYNTIRHGRSLFKMGRGLINLFTLHDVCEKLMMKHSANWRRRLRSMRLRLMAHCAPLLRLVGREDLGERDYILQDGSTIRGPRFSLNARLISHRRDVDSLMKDEMYSHTAEVEGLGNNSIYNNGMSDHESPNTPSVPFFVKTSKVDYPVQGGSFAMHGGSTTGTPASLGAGGSSYGSYPNAYRKVQLSDSLLKPGHSVPPLLKPIAKVEGNIDDEEEAEEDMKEASKSSSHGGGPTVLPSTLPLVNDPLHDYNQPPVASEDSQTEGTQRSPVLLHPERNNNHGEESSDSAAAFPDDRQDTAVIDSSVDHTHEHTFNERNHAVENSNSHLLSNTLNYSCDYSGTRSGSVAYAGGTVSGHGRNTDGEGKHTNLGNTSPFSAGLGDDSGLPPAPALGPEANDLSLYDSSNSTTDSNEKGLNDGLEGELIPVEAAEASKWRKGPLNFNSLLMVLLGVRSLCAACRRFMRDLTLVSSERFLILPFVEQNRTMLHRRINYLWLIVAVIDVVLNSIRLCQPGWTRYVTARQDVRYRCGCRGTENPNDTVWYLNGYVVRRKLDLKFPPLDLDFGAPYASTMNYFEAADPEHLQPACERCGYLYQATNDSHQPEEEKPRWLQLYDAASKDPRADAATASPSGAAIDTSSYGFLPVPYIVRKVFNYVWLLRVHPNLLSTILVQLRYFAELFLAWKYCFGGYEVNQTDAPLERILYPAGGIAGLVSAAVGLLRVVQSAPK